MLIGIVPTTCSPQHVPYTTMPITIPLLLGVSAFGLPLEALTNSDGRRPKYDKWGAWVNREQCSIADLLFWMKDGCLFKRCAADSFCHGYIRPPAG